MSIKLGNTDISKCYLGSTELLQAYLGTIELCTPQELVTKELGNSYSNSNIGGTNSRYDVVLFNDSTVWAHNGKGTNNGYVSKLIKINGDGSTGSETDTNGHENGVDIYVVYNDIAIGTKKTFKYDGTDVSEISGVGGYKTYFWKQDGGYIYTFGYMKDVTDNSKIKFRLFKTNTSGTTTIASLTEDNHGNYYDDYIDISVIGDTAYVGIGRDTLKVLPINLTTSGFTLGTSVNIGTLTDNREHLTQKIDNDILLLEVDDANTADKRMQYFIDISGGTINLVKTEYIINSTHRLNRLVNNRIINQYAIDHNLFATTDNKVGYIKYDKGANTYTIVNTYDHTIFWGNNSNGFFHRVTYNYNYLSYYDSGSLDLIIKN